MRGRVHSLVSVTKNHLRRGKTTTSRHMDINGVPLTCKGGNVNSKPKHMNTLTSRAGKIIVEDAIARVDAQKGGKGRYLTLCPDEREDREAQDGI